MKLTNAMMGGLGMGAYPKDDSKAAMNMYGASLEEERPPKHEILVRAIGSITDAIDKLTALIANIEGAERAGIKEPLAPVPKLESLQDVLDNGGGYLTELAKEIEVKEKTLRGLLF